MSEVDSVQCHILQYSDVHIILCTLIHTLTV